MHEQTYGAELQDHEPADLQRHIEAAWLPDDPVGPKMVGVPPPTGMRSRQPEHSDAEFQACRTIKVLFGMAFRQTIGFVGNLLSLAGLDWGGPDFSTLSRLQKALTLNIPYRNSKSPPHLPIDSTGIKAEGEGELI